MNKLVATAAALLLSSAAFAQVGTTVKESAKATSETIQQGGQNVAGAITPQPQAAVHKAKARKHKARARSHGRVAKAAARQSVR